MPNNITRIGQYAFRGCINLSNIDFPNKLTSIDIGAFEDCANLKEIVLPGEITSISRWAFRDCNLSHIIINAAIPPTIEATTFYINSSAVIYVPVESVDAYKTANIWSNYSNQINAYV